MSEYSNLQNSFFNLSDQDRVYLSSNFNEVEDNYKDYLSVIKGIPDQSQANEEYLLQSKLEMLNQKNERHHLKNVLLCWNATYTLPLDISQLEKAFKLLKEQMMMKVLNEKD